MKVVLGFVSFPVKQKLDFPQDNFKTFAKSITLFTPTLLKKIISQNYGNERKEKNRKT